MPKIEITDEEKRFCLSSLGTGINFFTINNKPVLHAIHTLGSGKIRGGCPICLPFFGPPPKEMDSFEKHGWVRKEEFQSWNVELREAGIEIKFHSIVPLQKYLQYPWSLEYEISYLFSYNNLRVSLEVKRLQDGIMEKAPINPAFHPYFPGKKVTIGGYHPSFSTKAYSKTIESLGISNEINIRTHWHHEILMELKGFEELYFWSDSPTEYVCVEPVAQSYKKFGTSEGIYLSQGEKRKFSMNLSII